MSLHYRHYHTKMTKANPGYGVYFWGYDIRQPTLDFYVGGHIFVFFWKSKHE